MKKDLKLRTTFILNIIFSVFVFIILIFIIFAFTSRQNDGIPKLFGKSYLTVLSNSMNTENEDYNFKGFKRGDMIRIKRYRWDEALTTTFEVGDIITFEWTNENGKLMYLTHRIIEVHEEEKYYITQGDVAAKNNMSTDPNDGHAERVNFVDVVGKYEKTIPWLGNVFLFLQGPIGFLIVVVIPLLGLFIYEIFNFRKAYIGYRNEKKGLTSEAKSTEELQKEIERLQRELQQKELNQKEKAN
ncbi:MAG TPA: signal peptidase I [Acholeplasmataceae bacterium]|nr:signal peptidase I [Acholeplasmataceae bacterium]